MVVAIFLWAWALITLTIEVVIDFPGGTDPYPVD